MRRVREVCGGERERREFVLKVRMVEREEASSSDFDLSVASNPHSSKSSVLGSRP